MPDSEYIDYPPTPVIMIDPEELAVLRALVAEVHDFGHARGICPANFGEQFRCKCGRREWLARAQWALGE